MQSQMSQSSQTPQAKPDSISSQEKRQLLQLSEVSLWVDNYDEFFSDFDPRPYSQRTLSDDFLHEAKKAVREKASGKVELTLLIPKNKRAKEIENVIKKD